jgi:hypothetical protein
MARITIVEFEIELSKCERVRVYGAVINFSPSICRLAATMGRMGWTASMVVGQVIWAVAAMAAPPHILFIVSDDLG